VMHTSWINEPTNSRGRMNICAVSSGTEAPKAYKAPKAPSP